MIKLYRNNQELGSYTSIQLAVNALPSAFDGDYHIKVDDNTAIEGFKVLSVDTSDFLLNIECTYRLPAPLTPYGASNVRVSDFSGRIRIKNFKISDITGVSSYPIRIDSSENVTVEDFTIYTITGETNAYVSNSQYVTFLRFTDETLSEKAVHFTGCENSGVVSSTIKSKTQHALFFNQVENPYLYGNLFDSNRDNDVEMVDCSGTVNIKWNKRYRATLYPYDSQTGYIINRATLDTTTLNFSNNIDNPAASGMRNLYVNNVKTVNVQQNHMTLGTLASPFFINNAEYFNHKQNTYFPVTADTIYTNTPFTVNFANGQRIAQRFVSQSNDYGRLKISNQGDSNFMASNVAPGGFYSGSTYADSGFEIGTPNLPDTWDDSSPTPESASAGSKTENAAKPDGYPANWHYPEPDPANPNTVFTIDMRAQKQGPGVYAIGNLTLVPGDVIGAYFSADNTPGSEREYAGGYFIVPDMSAYNNNEILLPLTCYKRWEHMPGADLKNGFDNGDSILFRIFKTSQNETFELGSVVYDDVANPDNGLFDSSTAHFTQATYTIYSFTPDYDTENLPLMACMDYIEKSGVYGEGMSYPYNVSYFLQPHQTIYFSAAGYGNETDVLDPAGEVLNHAYNWSFTFAAGNITYQENTTQYHRDIAIQADNVGELTATLTVYRQLADGSTQSSTKSYTLQVYGIGEPAPDDELVKGGSFDLITRFPSAVSFSTRVYIHGNNMVVPISNEIIFSGIQTNSANNTSSIPVSTECEIRIEDNDKISGKFYVSPIHTVYEAGRWITIDAPSDGELIEGFSEYELKWRIGDEVTAEDNILIEVLDTGVATYEETVSADLLQKNIYFNKYHQYNRNYDIRLSLVDSSPLIKDTVENITFTPVTRVVDLDTNIVRKYNEYYRFYSQDNFMSYSELLDNLKDIRFYNDSDFLEQIYRSPAQFFYIDFSFIPVTVPETAGNEFTLAVNNYRFPELDYTYPETILFGKKIIIITPDGNTNYSKNSDLHISWHSFCDSGSIEIGIGRMTFIDQWTQQYEELLSIDTVAYNTENYTYQIPDNPVLVNGEVYVISLYSTAHSQRVLSNHFYIAPQDSTDVLPNFFVPDRIYTNKTPISVIYTGTENATNWKYEFKQPLTTLTPEFVNDTSKNNKNPFALIDNIFWGTVTGIMPVNIELTSNGQTIEKYPALWYVSVYDHFDYSEETYISYNNKRYLISGNPFFIKYYYRLNSDAAVVSFRHKHEIKNSSGDVVSSVLYNNTEGMIGFQIEDAGEYTISNNVFSQYDFDVSNEFESGLVVVDPIALTFSTIEGQIFTLAEFLAATHSISIQTDLPEPALQQLKYRIFLTDGDNDILIEPEKLVNSTSLSLEISSNLETVIQPYLSAESQYKLKVEFYKRTVHNTYQTVYSPVFTIKPSTVESVHIQCDQIRYSGGNKYGNTTDEYTFKAVSDELTGSTIQWAISPATYSVVSGAVDENELVVTFDTADDYTISLEIETAGGDTLTDSLDIEAGDLPDVDFDNADAIYSQNYTFTNNSTGTDKYEWILKNALPGIVNNFTHSHDETLTPTVKFLKKGDADVILRGENNYGTAEVTKTISVTTTDREIEITYPELGEIFIKEYTYDLTWISSNISAGETLKISLIQGDSEILEIATGVDANAETYEWTIPNTSFDEAVNYQIKLEIETADPLLELETTSDEIAVFGNNIRAGFTVTSDSPHLSHTENTVFTITDNSYLASNYEYRIYCNPDNGSNFELTDEQLTFVNNTTRHSPSPQFKINMVGDEYSVTWLWKFDIEQKITGATGTVKTYYDSYAINYFIDPYISFELNSGNQIVRDQDISIVNNSNQGVTNYTRYNYCEWTFTGASIESYQGWTPPTFQFVQQGQQQVVFTIYLDYGEYIQKTKTVTVEYPAVNFTFTPESSYAFGETMPITWDAQNYSGMVKLYLRQNGTTAHTITPDPVQASLGAYQWQIPSSGLATGNYTIYIDATDAAYPDVYDETSEFAITYPSANLDAAFTLSPATGTYPSETGYGTSTTQFTFDPALSGGVGIDSYQWRFYRLVGIAYEEYTAAQYYEDTDDTSRYPVVSFPDTGTYRVQLTIQNTAWGQSDSEVRDALLDIGTLPDATFTINATGTVYLNQNVTFDVIEAENAGYTYAWEFTGANVSSSSNYEPTGVQFTSETGCSAKLTVTSDYGSHSYLIDDITPIYAQQITVTWPTEESSYEIGEPLLVTWDSQGLEGTHVNISLYRTSTGPQVLDFATNIPIENEIYQSYLIPQLSVGADYYVRIDSVENTGVYDNSDEFSILSVSQPIVANYDVYDNTIIINDGKGNTSTHFGFYDTSTGNPDTWLWEFSQGGTALEQGTDYTLIDGGTAQSAVMVQFSVTGTIDVSLTTSKAEGIITDTTTGTIEIGTPPDAEFTATGTGPGGKIYVYQAVTFDVIEAYSADNTYTWEFTGASIATSSDYEPAGVIFTQTTDCSAQLTVTNDFGTHTYYMDVSVFTAPSITITKPDSSSVFEHGETLYVNWSGEPSTGGENVKIELYRTSTGLEDTIVASTAFNSWAYNSYITPGTLTAASDYFVRITSLDDATITDDSEEFSIIEPPEPLDADFTYTDNTQDVYDGKGNTGTRFTFLSQSTGSPETWAWDFQQDGTPLRSGTDYTLISGGLDQRSLIVQFNITGIFDVELTITKSGDAEGPEISDTELKPDIIDIQEAPDAGFSVTGVGTFGQIYTNTNITFHIDEPEDPAVTYYWQFVGANIESYTGYNPTSQNVQFTRTDNCQIRFTATSDYGQDSNTVNPTVLELPTITVNRPELGDTFEVGQFMNIQWDATGLDGRNVEIHLGRDSAGIVREIVSSVSANKQSYSYQVELLPPAEDYYVRVRSIDYPTLASGNSALFEIADPTTPLVSEFLITDNTTTSTDGKGNTDTVFTLTDQTSGQPTAWAWEFMENGVNLTLNEDYFVVSGGINQQNVQVTFAGNGTYDVKLNVSKAGGTITDSELKENAIDVQSKPESKFTINGNGTIYYNENLSLDVNAPPAIGNTYTWHFEGANIATSTSYEPTGVYFVQGHANYSVRLSVLNDYGSTQTIKSELTPQVRKTITVTSPTSGQTFYREGFVNVSWDQTGLDGTTLLIQGLNKGTPVNGMMAEGVSADAGSYKLPVPANAPVSSGYKVLVRSEIWPDVQSYSEFFEVATQNITLYPDFNYAPSVGVVNDTVFYLNGFTNDDEEVSAWQWEFFYNDGTPADDQVSFTEGSATTKYCAFKLLSAAIYDVKLTVTNRAGNTFSITKFDTAAGAFDVGELPDAEFTINGGASVVINTDLTFNVLEAENENWQYQWIFTGANINSSTDYEPTGVQFTQETGCAAQLTVTNSYGSHTYLTEPTITVVPNLEVTYPVAGSSHQANQPLNILLTFNSQVDPDKPITMQLYKGDPLAGGTAIDTIMVQQTVLPQSGNTYSYSDYIIPTSSTVPEIVYGDDDYYIEVLYNQVPPMTFQRAVGNAFTITEPEAPQMEAVFSVTDNTQNTTDKKGNTSTKFTCTNTSSGLNANSTFEWEITKGGTALTAGELTFYEDANGDMTSLTTKHLVVALPENGTFDLRLKISLYGFDDWSEAQQITVNSAPVADFSIATPVYNNQPITITNNSTDVQTYKWTFEDANGEDEYITFEQTPSNVYFNSTGDKTVTLETTSPYGQDELISVVTVESAGNVIPVADFHAGKQWGNPSNQIQFYDDTTNSPSQWYWQVIPSTGVSIDDENAQNPKITFANTGDYTVKLTATNAYGSDTEQKDAYIKIRNAPAADFEADDTTPEIGVTVALTNNSIGGETYQWSFWYDEACTEAYTMYELVGTGAALTDENINIKFLDPTYVTVRLTTLNTGDATHYGGDIETKANYINVQTIQPTGMIEITSPNGEELYFQGQEITIEWTDNISENVKIELLKGGATEHTIVESTASDGSYTATLPQTLAVGSDYKVKVSSVSDPVAEQDISDANFSIQQMYGTNQITGNLEIADEAGIPMDSRALKWELSDILNPHEGLITFPESEGTGKLYLYLLSRFRLFDPTNQWNPNSGAYPPAGSEKSDIWLVVADGTYDGTEYHVGDLLHWDGSDRSLIQTSGVGKYYIEEVTTDVSTTADKSLYLVTTGDTDVTITLDDYTPNKPLNIVKTDSGSGFVFVSDGTEIVWSLYTQYDFVEFINNTPV